MPTVPIIENNVKSRGFDSSGSNALISNIPQFRDPAPVADFSGFIRAGGQLKQMALDMKRKADETALIDAQTKLDEAEIQLFYDKDNGAFSKQGRNALNITNTAGGEYRKFGQKLREGLGNEDQRRAFDKMFSNRFNTAQRQLNTHERQQMNAFQGAVAEQGISSALNHAALNYNDPEIVAQSIDRAQSIARVKASRSGLPVGDTLNKIESTGQTNALLAMIADGSAANILQAKGRFEALKKDGVFTAADLIRIDSKLDSELPDAAATVEFNALGGKETASEISTLAKSLENQYAGAGLKFEALVEKRDTAAFYQQADDDPLAAVAKLEDGDYPGIKAADKRRLINHAQGMFEKQDEDARFRRLANMTEEQEALNDERIRGVLTFSKIDAYESANKDNPEAVEFAQAMKENLSKSETAKGKMITDIRDAKEKEKIKEQEGPSKIQKDEFFNSLWADYKEMGISVDKNGKLSNKGTQEKITDILRLQTKIQKGLSSGLIEEGEAKQFKNLTVALRSRVDKADNLFSSLSNDVYADAYEQALDFLSENENIDTEANRRALFTAIFKAAEIANVDKIEDLDEREQVVQAIGVKAIEAFAKTIDPSLSGLEGLPDVVVRSDGQAIKFQKGNARADAKVKPSVPMKEEYTTKNGSVITIEQIRETAKNRGKTPQDVIRDLRAQGIIE